MEITSLLWIIALLIVVFIFFGSKVIPEGKVALLFRGGKFLGIRKSGIVIMIPFYDKLTMPNLEMMDLNIPQKMVIASDRDKIYFSGSISVKIKEPQKAYTEVSDFKNTIITATSDALEEKIKKSTLAEIKASRRDFDEQILKLVREKSEDMGIDAKKIKLNIDR